MLNFLKSGRQKNMSEYSVPQSSAWLLSLSLTAHIFCYSVIHVNAKFMNIECLSGNMYWAMDSIDVAKLLNFRRSPSLHF